MIDNVKITDSRTKAEERRTSCAHEGLKGLKANF